MMIIQEKRKNEFGKKYIKNIIFILIVLVFTFGYAIDYKELVEIPSIISSLDKKYLLLSSLTMFLFFLCQAYVEKKLLHSFGYKVSFKQCFRYTLIDYYFSAITPGASGGQPSEIYYMKKDGIDIGASSLTMLIYNGLYHLSVLVVVFSTAFGNIREILGQDNIFLRLFQVGIFIQIVLTICFFFLIFSKTLVYKLSKNFIELLRKFKYKKVDNLEIKIQKILKDYKEGAIWLKNNSKIFLKILPLTIFQLALFYSMAYWIGKSFGLKNLNFLKMIAYQGVFTMTFESLPLPGGVGLAEAGFLHIFSSIYKKGDLPAALLLTRGLSYYGFLLIGAIITFFSKGEKVHKTKITA